MTVVVESKEFSHLPCSHTKINCIHTEMTAYQVRKDINRKWSIEMSSAGLKFSKIYTIRNRILIRVKYQTEINYYQAYKLAI